MPRSSDPALPRRRFLKTVGLAGLTTALAPAALAMAQTPAPTPAKPDSAAAPATPPAPAPPSEDAKALAAIIERRYGKHLTREQLEAITRDLDGDQRAFERLRAVKLANADEPDATFFADGGARG